MDQFEQFLNKINQYDPALCECAKLLYRSIFEQSSTDVNSGNKIPDPNCCKDSIANEDNEWFDESTSASPEMVANAEQAKIGKRTWSFSAGRDSLGMCGNGLRSGYQGYTRPPQNVCSSTATDAK